VNGIGYETADSILLYALGRPSFVVDAYTQRVFTRLTGVVPDSVHSRKYHELQAFLGNHETYFPSRVTLYDENGNEESSQSIDDRKQDKIIIVYNEFHALIVEHAKRHCRKKAFCEGCPLSDICRYFATDIEG